MLGSALAQSLRVPGPRPAVPRPGRRPVLPGPAELRASVLAARNGREGRRGSWWAMGAGAVRRPVMAVGDSRAGKGYVGPREGGVAAVGGVGAVRLGSEVAPVAAECDCPTDDASGNATTGVNHRRVSTVGKSTNIVWHECPVGKLERQKLLRQKGCVIWITGLSGSGKSTMACALSRELYCRGHLSYLLDGDNVRHGLNKDLSFKPEDRAENIRRIGFTGIDDPYEPPLNCEIVIQQENGVCPSPTAMAGQVISYLQLKGYLQA